MKPFGSMGKWQVTPEPGQTMKEDKVGGRRTVGLAWTVLCDLGVSLSSLGSCEWQGRIISISLPSLG